MKNRWLFFALLLLVAGGALAFRLPGIDLRPVHHDEANQAVKAGALIDEGFYQYDPHDHHGPTLYYCALPVVWLTGVADGDHATEFTYRIIQRCHGSSSESSSNI